MIASRLGLAITFAIAFVLGGLLVIDGGPPAPVSRALVSLDLDRLVRLAWSRPGDPEVVLERTGTTWRWTRPLADIPASPAAVDAVVAALRGGRWHRRAPLARAGALRTVLVATAGDRQVRIGVGDSIAGADQTWIAIDTHAYLVDAWLARALSPPPLALREIHPLAAAAAAETIVIERAGAPALRLQGHPRRLVRPYAIYLDARHAAGLERALTALEIVAVPTSPGAAITTLTIDTPHLVTVEHRPGAGCPSDTVGIGGTLGPGCIPAAQWAAAEAALDLLRSPPAQLASPHPIPFDPIRITFSDGAILDLAKRPRIGDRDVDPAHLAELLATLAMRCEIEPTTADLTPLASLLVTGRAGETVTLELLPRGRVRRRGEPVALVLDGTAWRVLARPSTELRDPTPWSEEPTTIRAITIDSRTFTRGAVIGEWTDTPDPARIEALARLLARPRVAEAPRRPTQILHTVSFEVAAPGAPVVTHTLQLGPRCLAELAAQPPQPVVLESTLCDAITRVGQK